MSTPAACVVAGRLAALGHTNLYDLLKQASHVYGDKTAFSCGADSVSFTELRDKSDSFARYLRHELGLQPGDRLAIQLPNLLQYEVTIFGALKAGLVIVNTNPQYTVPETRHQFTDSGARAVVVLDKLVPLVRAVQGETAIERLIVTSVDDWSNPQVASDEADVTRFMAALTKGKALPEVDPQRGLEDLAVLQYTGGTTGVSKGAMLTHNNLLCNVLQAVSILSPGELEYGNEVRVSPLPLYHVFAFTANCLASVFTGFNSVLITNPRDLVGMIADMRGHRIPLFTGINPLFVALMAHPDSDTVDYSNVKWVTAGGA